jgi:hypothetical protein
MIEQQNPSTTGGKSDVDKTANQPMSHQRRVRTLILAFFLALNFAFRLYVSVRPLEYIDGTIIPDDTYLSLDIARSIARGEGPLYGNEYTNGFQPLYVFLMVPVYALIPNDPVTPVHVALGVLSAVDTLALYILLRLICRWTSRSATPVLIALAWIVNPYFIATATNGLETVIAAFFFVAGLYYLDKYFVSGQRSQTTARCLILGGIIGLAAFARIDNLFFGLVAAITILLLGVRELPATLRRLLLIALAAVIVYLPWLLYSYAYTGDLYPVSGKAVRLISLSVAEQYPTAYSWYSNMVKTAFRSVVTHNEIVLVLLAVVLVVLGILRGLQRSDLWFLAKSLGPAWGYAIILFCAYSLYIFTPWFFDRYLHPIGIVLLLTLASVSDLVFARLRKSISVVVLSGSLAMSAILVNVTDPRFSVVMFSTVTEYGYRNIGLWAQKEFPSGTVVGSAQSGAIGYFAENLIVVNLDGVVSKSCYESLALRENLQYIRDRRVQYVIGWKENYDFLLNRSTGLRKEDLAMKVIDGVKAWGHSWYLWEVGQ